MGLALVTFPSIKIVSSRDFYFCSIGIFFLWHVMSSCLSRWRQGSSCQPPLGGGEGWQWLCRRQHSAAVGLQAREAGPPLLPLDAPSPRGWPGCSLRQHACLPNPSCQTGIFGGTVFLLVSLGYSVFQLLPEKKKNRKKERKLKF